MWRTGRLSTAVLDEKIADHLLHQLEAVAAAFVGDNPGAALEGAVQIGRNLDGDGFQLGVLFL